MNAGRLQALDIGDTVRPANPILRDAIEPMCVIDVLPEPDLYLLRSPNGLIVPAGRPGMERVGGALQPGDWVRVTGPCRTIRGTDREQMEDEVGLIVDTLRDGGPEFLVCMRGLVDLFECSAAQLTRIARAEALA